MCMCVAKVFGHFLVCCLDPWTELEIQVTNLFETFSHSNKMRTHLCGRCMYELNERHRKKTKTTTLANVDQHSSVLSVTQKIRLVFFSAIINFLWNALICEWCSIKRVIVDAWQMNKQNKKKLETPVQKNRHQLIWFCYVHNSNCFGNSIRFVIRYLRTDKQLVAQTRNRME